VNRVKRPFKQYEYEVIDSPLEKAKERLKEAGQNGWEAIAASTYGSVHLVVLLKKEKGS